MKIGQEYKSCRYWGFEPAISDDARRTVAPGTAEYAARATAREKLVLIRKDAKLHGMKASDMGLTKKVAIARAEKLEKQFPGVEWSVFNHDYL